MKGTVQVPLINRRGSETGGIAPPVISQRFAPPPQRLTVNRRKSVTQGVSPVTKKLGSPVKGLNWGGSGEGGGEASFAKPTSSRRSSLTASPEKVGEKFSQGLREGRKEDPRGKRVGWGGGRVGAARGGGANGEGGAGTTARRGSVIKKSSASPVAAGSGRRGPPPAPGMSALPPPGPSFSVPRSSLIDAAMDRMKRDAAQLDVIRTQAFDVVNTEAGGKILHGLLEEMVQLFRASSEVRLSERR